MIVNGKKRDRFVDNRVRIKMMSAIQTVTKKQLFNLFRAKKKTL